MCRNCSCLIAKGDVFCAICQKTITPAVSLHLAAGYGHTLKIHAIGTYQDPLKKMILKKFSYDILVSKQLARLMLSYTPFDTMPVDMIIPVPLHWTRYATRGFNQSHEMAKVLVGQSGATLCTEVKRTRKTAYQSTLESAERKKNVHGAFGLNPSLSLEDCKKLFTGKHILIVDDLCTTGATLVNIAKTITPYGPASVSAIVACRAV
jgi:ComF family protein